MSTLKYCQQDLFLISFVHPIQDYRIYIYIYKRIPSSLIAEFISISSIHSIYDYGIKNKKFIQLSQIYLIHYY
jgi:hypothetical protein